MRNKEVFPMMNPAVGNPLNPKNQNQMVQRQIQPEIFEFCGDCTVAVWNFIENKAKEKTEPKKVEKKIIN